MSLRRKKHDGNIVGGNTGIAKRRNSFGSKSPVEQYAPTRQSRRGVSRFKLVEEEIKEDETKDRYLLTYADLITLLLGLFIILYAISNIDIAKYKKITAVFGDVFGDKGEVIGLDNTDVAEGLTPNQKLRQDLIDLVAEYNYDNSIKIDEDKRGIIIHILDKLLFGSGNADLSKGSLEVLHRLANILKNIPNDIRVEGHTDNVPIHSRKFPSNWHLSVARALNTAYYLISKEKLSPDRVSIVGYSEYKPVAENDTPEGRQQNRRVDIVIINKNQK